MFFFFYVLCLENNVKRALTNRYKSGKPVYIVIHISLVTKVPMKTWGAFLALTGTTCHIGALSTGPLIHSANIVVQLDLFITIMSSMESFFCLCYIICYL